MISRLAPSPACALLFAALVPFAACAGGPQTQEARYMGASVTPLDNELTRVEVSVSGKSAPLALPGYAECVGAQYTKIRGLSYMRQLSSTQRQRGDLRLGTVVYVLSGKEPDGASIINAEQTVTACKAAKIPVF